MILIRFSLNNDTCSLIRNTRIVPLLEGAGFRRQGTGEFVLDHSTAAGFQAISQMIDALSFVGGNSRVGGVAIDHFWIYFTG